MLQFFCSVLLQCVAAVCCCSVLLKCAALRCSVLQCAEVCCIALQCVAVLQCVALRCSVLQCVCEKSKCNISRCGLWGDNTLSIVSCTIPTTIRNHAFSLQSFSPRYFNAAVHNGMNIAYSNVFSPRYFNTGVHNGMNIVYSNLFSPRYFNTGVHNVEEYSSTYSTISSLFFLSFSSLCPPRHWNIDMH